MSRPAADLVPAESGPRYAPCAAWRRHASDEPRIDAMRPAVPLSLQLLLTFVGLLIGLTAVLTSAANSSLLANLETEARRTVGVATRAASRRSLRLSSCGSSAPKGFLASVEIPLRRAARFRPSRRGSTSCVPDDGGRIPQSERALGVLLTYGNRRLRARRQAASRPDRRSVGIARARGSRRRRRDRIRDEGQPPRGVPHAADSTTSRSPISSTITADSAAPARCFSSTATGQFLTHSRRIEPGRPPSAPRSSSARCGRRPTLRRSSTIAADQDLQSFRPPSRCSATSASARACATRRRVAPADRLREDLFIRERAGSWLIGVVLSLVAAQWISAPVRRLAHRPASSRPARFDRPLPLGGPSEVRALGHALQRDGQRPRGARGQGAERRGATPRTRTGRRTISSPRVSHELRTPLTAVLGWAQMLQAERRAGRAGCVTVSRSSSAAPARRRQLIEDLLDVSRIVSNRLRIAREPVPARRGGRGGARSVRPQAAAKHVEIQRDLSDAGAGARRSAPARAGRLEPGLERHQVHQPSGRITVQLTRDDALAGAVGHRHRRRHLVGLPAVRVRVVPPGRSRGARSQAGLGLGLGIVRHIVQLHGGSVRAESAGRRPRRDLHRDAAGARARAADR